MFSASNFRQNWIALNSSCSSTEKIFNFKPPHPPPLPPSPTIPTSCVPKSRNQISQKDSQCVTLRAETREHPIFCILQFTSSHSSFSKGEKRTPISKFCSTNPAAIQTIHQIQITYKNNIQQLHPASLTLRIKPITSLDSSTEQSSPPL